MTPAASASSRISRTARATDRSSTGIKILENLAHRGAVGADPLAGDGAGILIQLPDRLFRAEAERLGFALPEPGNYGVGMVFLPRHAETRAACEETIAELVAAEGQTLLGWRDVPRDSAVLGESIKPIEPVIRQFFVARGANCADADAFERKLFVIRKQCHKSVRARAPARGQRLLHRQPVDPHRHLQGHDDRRAARALLQGPRRRAHGIGLGAGPCALLDQHLPVLGAGASVPLSRA